MTKATWPFSLELRPEYALCSDYRGKESRRGSIREAAVTVQGEMVAKKVVKPSQMQGIFVMNH